MKWQFSKGKTDNFKFQHSKLFSIFIISWLLLDNKVCNLMYNVYKTNMSSFYAVVSFDFPHFLTKNFASIVPVLEKSLSQVLTIDQLSPSWMKMQTIIHKLNKTRLYVEVCIRFEHRFQLYIEYNRNNVFQIFCTDKHISNKRSKILMCQLPSLYK